MSCATCAASHYLTNNDLQGLPSNAGDDVQEDDYIDVIGVTKAPDEANIQILEQQCLAIRNVTDGFELNTSWLYEDICYFLETHFKFLFRYFKEGPNSETATNSESPFMVVHKNHQTLTAVSYEPNMFDGEVLRRNCMLQKKSFLDVKLFFGMSIVSLV